MISHPGNPAFPIDIQAVVKAAGSRVSRVALEVNNSSFSHSPVQAAKATAAPSSRRRATSAPTSPSAPTPVAFSLGDFDHCHRLVTGPTSPRSGSWLAPRALLDFLESRGRAHIPEFADL